MWFAIRFTDNPAAFSVRETYFAAHLEWLAQHRARIKAAGSLRQKPDERPAGALWIVEAENEEQALALFAEDPFWVEGLRASVEIHAWSLAFDDMLTG
ncbi:hypothetical protein HP564_03465 [Pantoea sp. KPR_PJ]